MSDACTHDCSTCSANCDSRENSPKSLLEKPHALSSVKKVIGIVSGKGGVGKSLVTSLLAVHMQREGYHAGILDADLTGPSIPRAFGLKSRAEMSEQGLYPVRSTTGIDIMSLNLLTEDETDPVVWRGPVISGFVKQFWTDVIWDNIDFLFVDMPPGTGDVPLTIFQSLPVDGIIVVTSPQDLVSMIVSKALKMANMMHIPVLGIVENMSSVKGPDCGREIPIFGESKLGALAEKFGIEHTARIPIDPNIAAAVDSGRIETIDCEQLRDTAVLLGGLLKD